MLILELQQEHNGGQGRQTVVDFAGNMAYPAMQLRQVELSLQ